MTHRRPVLLSSPEVASEDDAEAYTQRLELAYLTARAVLGAGDDATYDSIADIPGEVGLDTLAELWSHAPALSIPGVLWRLYLLHAWCAEGGEQIARFYMAGRGLAPVDEIVAGAAEPAGPEEIASMAHGVLTGAGSRDFAVALERAAAFFRVIAAGRQALAPEGREEDSESQRAERHLRAADVLTEAAGLYRRGELV